MALLLVFQGTKVQGSDNFSENLFGIWETEPSTSQLGTIITKYNFKDNDECVVSVKFLDAKLNEIEEKGFCKFKRGKLIITNRNGVFKNTYSFSNGILTITEKNGDTYKLKRKN